MSDDLVEDIGFDDETIKDDKKKNYKGTQGQTDRIGIIMTDKIKLKKAKVHFLFGKYVLCKGGLCCEMASKPSEYRIGAVIIQYSTNNQGDLKKPLNYELKPWVFSQKKFLALKRVNGEFPFAEHDVKVFCKEQQYQQLEFTSCKESLWQKSEKLKTEVESQLKAVQNQIWLGSELSNDELKELAGMESEGVDGDSGGGDVVSDENYDDILNNL